MPDSLGLNLKRRVILMYGLPGVGKSWSVVKLIEDAKEKGKNVVVIDRDRGLADDFLELGYTDDTIPDNFDYFNIDSWDKLREARDYALEVLGKGDWLVIEGAHRIWKFARTDFIYQAYDMQEDEFMEMKRHEAQTQIEEFFADPKNIGIDRETEEGVKELRRIRGKVLQYEGLDGRSEWPKITTKYMAALEPMFISGDFNILTTTAAQRIDKQIVEEEPEWTGVGTKPQGQKDLVGMHSTMMRVYIDDGVHYFDTDLRDAAKDRGKPLFKRIAFSDIGAITAYEDELEEHAAAQKKPAPKKKAAAK